MASTITSFSGANGSSFTVDGEGVEVQNANQSWSLTEPNSDTLQFSVESGDHWSTSGWSDLTDDDGANRSEIQFSQNYSAGTQINISETLTVEPGATSTASFLALNQLHATTNSPPAPFSLQLDQSDHLEVVLQSPNNSYNLVYRSPNPIVRGQPMDLSFQLNMGPSGNGYVGVWLDGNQIVNYHGAVGATGAEYYWKEGIYRGSASESITADYSNVQITTGTASSTSGSTTGTTSTGTTSSGTTTASGGTTSSGGSSSSGTTSGSTTGSTSTGTTSSGTTSSGTTTASGGTTSSGDSSSSGTTSGSSTGSTSTGSTSGSTTDPTGSTSSSGTSGSGTTTSTTPVAPTLTVANHSLSVSPGGTVSLGLGVSVPHVGDNVSVTISGLPKYETITDKLDGKTFSGSSVTLTAAEVNSGLSLSSSFTGRGHPTATLTVTAHDATGTPVTSAAQTITVVDPPATTTSSGTSTTTSSGTSTTTSGGGTTSGQSNPWGWRPRGIAGITSETSTTTSGTSSGQSAGGRTSIAQWFNDHSGFAPTATTLSEAGASRSRTVPNVTSSTTSSSSSTGARAYALLNQMMANDFRSESHFAQTATALSASSQQQANLLTRSLH